MQHDKYRTARKRPGVDSPWQPAAETRLAFLVSRARRSLRHRAGDARVIATIRATSAIGRLRGQRVVHMLHIRKTGGTAVKAALRDIAPVPGLRLVLNAHRVPLRGLPAADDVFFFLRDPVARYISGFESRRREGRPAHYHPWNRLERRAYERFQTAEALALALTSDDPEQRDVAEQAMNGIMHVRSRLSDWLGDRSLLEARRERIILVGWQETLTTDFQRLVDLLGLPVATNLPTHEAAAHRSSPDEPPEELSDEAAATIRDWYASDYRLIDDLVDLGLTTRPK